MNASSEFDEPTQERAALHVLGLLGQEEGGEFEREMWTRPGLRDLVLEMRLGLEEVARMEVTRSAPALLRETLLEQVEHRPASNPPIAFPAYVPEVISVSPPANIVWLPWAAAAALALLCAFFLFQRNAAQAETKAQTAKANAATDMATAASAQAAGLNRRLVDLEAETTRLRAETVRLAQTQPAAWSKLRVAALRTTPSANPASTAGGLILWDADQGSGMLTIRNLPPAPAGRDYQLWIVDPSQPKPLNGGVFKTSADGTAQVYFRATSATKVRADKFAISLEPEGGRPVAEGPIFMAGN